MTASPPVNGHKRPTMPVLGEWQAVTPEPEPVEEQRNPQPEPAVDAEVARARAWAEAEERRVAAEAEKEERRIKAQAEADAVRAAAEENARKLRLANDRQERKDRESAAASEARIAESNLKRDDAERARHEASRQDAEQKQAEQTAAKEIADADDEWRAYAIKFAIVCGIVSLPVQMSFFWNPRAPWMAAAPIMLEGAAWVVHRGARAAAVSKRPVWHYRTIVWLLAFLAAGVNLYHGLHSFDPGTAVATAFASIAGPGVWDLHENGRIRKRDGVLTRRERKARAKVAKAEAKQKAADEARRQAEREAAAKAAEEAAAKLAADREERFPDVWEHALGLAAALGETTVTEAVWRRAHKDVKGTDPGDSPEAQQLRNTAARRMLDARADAPEKSVWKIQDAQVNPQVPPTRRRGSVTGPPVRGTRRAGDTPKFVDAARKQASITAKNAIEKDPS
jgi:chemotaxis protein histidine kinase CheA